MLSKEEIEKAKETMSHWVDYEKQNKEKINKADELIGIQQTLLQYIDQLEQENNKQNKIIEEIAMWIYDKDYNNQEILLLQERYEDYYSNNLTKIKQYFEKKVEEK